MSGYTLPKGYKPVVTPRYSGNQMQMINALMGQMGTGSSSALQHLNQMAAGSPEYYAGRENQMMNDFRNKILPVIKQNFAHQGMLGSSAFQGAMSQAGEQLGESMYNQRNDLQRQSINDLLGLTQNFMLNPTQEFGYTQKMKKPNIFERTLGYLNPMAQIGSLMTSPTGLGGGLSSLAAWLRSKPGTPYPQLGE